MASFAGYVAMVALLGGDLASGSAGGVATAGLTVAQSILAQGVGFSLGFAAATWLVGVKGARLSWADLRWHRAGPPMRGAAVGLLLGGAAAGLAMALALPAGAAWTRDAGGLGSWFGAAAQWVAVLLPAALWEEFALRGVPLVLLAGVMGKAPASVITAVAFGALHANNPGATPLGVVNTGVAGLFLAAAFWAPGGIWTATGAHLGWNAVIATLEAPVSGIPFAMPFLDYHPGGPAWLTGGSFGPEGGLLATVAIIGATGAVLRWMRRAGAA
ncbi:MAG TPA: CPBP family intramembrane glutamic endopeptidase [Gemmatimonadales bacterium]|nr:CPBP family intramembrane glutamic endopeptidase [Gemmatimonadales bacterium]